MLTKLFSLITILLWGSIIFAQQAPNAFKYQAVARDANNQPYSNTNLRIRIGIANEAGIVTYAETHNVTTSDLGLFSLNIGKGTIVSGSFSNINWGASSYFLNLELSNNNGASYFSMGSSPLLAVPYALYAAKAQTVDGGTQNVQVTAPLSGNGTAASPLSIPDNSINSTKIQNGSILATDLAAGVIPNYKAGSGINLKGDTINATDNSATNELQTLSLNGSDLSISRGNSIKLPTIGNNYWQSAGGKDIIYNNEGTVFFGGGVAEAILAGTNNSSTTMVVQQNGPGKALLAEGRNSKGEVMQIIGGIGGLTASGENYGISGINVGPTGGYGVVGESKVSHGTGGSFRNENGIGLEVIGSVELCYKTESGLGGYYCSTIKGVANTPNAFEIGADWRPDAINNGRRNLGASNARWNTVYAVNGVINTSDANQKQAIQPLSYGLQQVMAMKPVSFKWSDHPERGRKIGFLAQELQEVVPEVVADQEWQVDENGEMVAKKATALGVYYSDLIPVLTKAIQEQQKQIELQQSQIDRHTEEINALKAVLETQRRDMARLLTQSGNTAIEER